MHSTTTFRVTRHQSPPQKTRSQKIVREFARLMKQANTLAMRPVALATGNHFLFIVSHMRSGSSLLCHLLCSADEIIGFGEAHHSYSRRSDLARLLWSVRHYTGKNPLRYRYVLDKIVGTQHDIGPAVLADRRTRYIFLLREPRPTIASIVAMSHEFQNASHAEIIHFATNYYHERLEQLAGLVEKIDAPQRCLVLTHRELVSDTQVTFGAIENFLGLAAPLREAYEVVPTTGRIGFGDPSPNIQRGRIDRSLPRKEVLLPAELWARVERAYDHCLANLSAAVPRIGSRRTELSKAA